MIPKEHLGRANGMYGLIEVGPQVVAPILAGALLPLIKLTGILFIDVVTFLTAIAVLLIIHVPQPERSALASEINEESMLKQAGYGFRYIFARPSLLGLQLIFFTGNLFSGIGFAVFTPMVLLRTGNNELLLGSALSAGAIAAVIGGVVMSAWGGFKRRVHGVLLGWLFSGLGFSIMGFAGGLPIWIIGSVASSILVSLINGSNQAIWQSKVPPDIQGRVFSSRTLIAWLTNPISPVIGGVLADYVLEPAARAGTGLPAALAWLVGTGPGSGMGALIVVCGLLCAIVGLAGYFSTSIREAESILPDHDLPAALEPA